MPLDGEQLNDLLSGFIDGALSEVERAQVEEAARSDARIAQRIKTLEQQSSWIRQCGNELVNAAAASSPQSSLAQRVILESQRRARELGLPDNHYTKPYAPGTAEPTQVSPAPETSVALASSRRSSRWLAGSGMVAAAALLISVTWLTLVHRSGTNPVAKPDDNSIATIEVLGGEREKGNEAQEGERHSNEPLEIDAQSMGSSLVGKSDGMSYALVVDAQVTAKARREQVLERILAGSGIPMVAPLMANAEIRKVLDDSRMIVRNPTADANLVSIQMLRGDIHELDLALREVWKDVESFPNVGLNLSIDSRATLMRAMLRSSETLYLPSESFAIPLAVAGSPTTNELVDRANDVGDPISGSASPFPANDGNVQYVSSSQRASGWMGAGDLTVSPPDTVATILLVLHLVD